MKKDSNFVAAWLESENSLQKEYVCETSVSIRIASSLSSMREGAAEKVLDVAEAVLSTGAVDMFVINSLKAMVPSEEFENPPETPSWAFSKIEQPHDEKVYA